MAKKKDNIKIDITQMSVEELKQLGLNDLLVYIDEVQDSKTVIVYLFKIIKQITNKHEEIEEDSNHILAEFRKRFRNTNDLQEKLDEIYNLIEDNNLLLDFELEPIKNSIEIEIDRLNYKNLKEIDKLEEQGLNIPYNTAKEQYNDVKEHLTNLSSKICDLYVSVRQDLEDQNRALGNSVRLLQEINDTPNVATGVNMGNPLEQQVQDWLTKANMINRENIQRKRNEEKAKEFYEKQEKLKKKRGIPNS